MKTLLIALYILIGALLIMPYLGYDIWGTMSSYLNREDSSNEKYQEVNSSSRAPRSQGQSHPKDDHNERTGGGTQKKEELEGRNYPAVNSDKTPSVRSLEDIESLLD